MCQIGFIDLPTLAGYRTPCLHALQIALVAFADHLEELVERAEAVFCKSKDQRSKRAGSRTAARRFVVMEGHEIAQKAHSNVLAEDGDNLERSKIKDQKGRSLKIRHFHPHQGGNLQRSSRPTA